MTDQVMKNPKLIENQVKNPIDIYRGISKSRRTWREPVKKFNTQSTRRASKDSYALRRQKQDLRRRRNKFLNDLKDEKKEELRNEREARKERQRRKEENIIRSSTYQVITNTAKIKKMSKKQRKRVMKLSDVAKR